MTILHPDEALRYARHLSLPEVGPAGQARLGRASIALVGLGGLGSPAALYLTAAGVGRLGLIDDDVVEPTNLQRQVLYGDADVGRSKVDAAADALAPRNPHVRLDRHRVRLRSDNALDVLAPYDLVIDGTDDFGSRYVVSDACVLLGRPNVHGSVYRFEGLVSTFGAADGPCYRCLHPSPPPPESVPSCAEGGVLGILPGIIGTLQAAEAVKWVLGIGRPLAGRLLMVDALTMAFREWRIERDPSCPACGDAPAIRTPGHEATVRAADPPEVPSVEARELAQRLLAADPPFLVDVREPHELDCSRLAAAHHIPLGELPRRLGELPHDRSVVVLCRTDARSRMAVMVLRGAGFERVEVLRGGILAWASEVDPTLATS
jgi:sulfur-carrier protein adenylyltransferase/sulfurtransferase